MTEKQQYMAYLDRLSSEKIQQVRHTMAINALDDVNYNAKYLRKLIRWIDQHLKSAAQ